MLVCYVFDMYAVTFQMQFSESKEMNALICIYFVIFGVVWVCGLGKGGYVCDGCLLYSCR